MADDIAVPLTQDEASVLMIAAQGQSLIAIGRWEKPIDSLVKRGLLHANDKFNNVITDAGAKALEGHERNEDAVLLKVINKQLEAQHTQTNIQTFAEQAAQLLAQAARTSAEVTGDTETWAADQWGQVIIKRARELLETKAIT